MIRFDQATVEDPAGGPPLLHRWELLLQRGELAVLSGGRAAARAAALELLHGRRRPDAGAVHLGGVALDSLSEAGVQRLRRCVATWSATPRLIGAASLLENVALPLRLRDLPPVAQERRARAALEDAGLAAFAHRRAAELPLTIQRRAEAARAAASGAEVWLVDGPWLGLDPDAQAQLLDLLLAAWLRGVTLLLTAADPAPLLSLRPRLLALQPDGSLRQELPGQGIAHAPLNAPEVHHVHAR